MGDSLSKKAPGGKTKKSKADGGFKDEISPEEHPEAARLSDIVHEFETIGNKCDYSMCVYVYYVVDNFERAAALALWHGDTSLAVRVLQRTVEACTGKRAANDDSSSVDEYDGASGRFIDDLTPGGYPNCAYIGWYILIVCYQSTSNFSLWLRCALLDMGAVWLPLDLFRTVMYV